MTVNSDFKPQLWPTKQVPPHKMKYPLVALHKLDGVRCIIKDGQLFSRSMKPLPNNRLPVRFEKLLSTTKEKGVVFDGELYSPALSFQEIVSVVMSEDKELPQSLEFWCFDMPSDKPYIERLTDVHEHIDVPCIPFYYVETPEQTEEIFLQATGKGCEGLILTNPDSLYKHGRITIKSGDGYKYKPYETFDAQIVGVTQAEVVDPSAEKKINELGYSETSKKKDDRRGIQMAACFVVDYEGTPFKVPLNMTEQEKRWVWDNRRMLIGKWIEYKGMLYGAKDVPRHPGFLRYREDRDD